MKTMTASDRMNVGLERIEMRLRFAGAISLGLLQHWATRLADSICRTAVYVTRPHGGVGGGSREAAPYPD
jgi:hypothetical protein